MLTRVLEYVPFGVLILAGLGLTEKRLSQKVDKTTCDERIKVIERLEVRMMRIEGHLLDKALTKKEAEILVRKNNN